MINMGRRCAVVILLIAIVCTGVCEIMRGDSGVILGIVLTVVWGASVGVINRYDRSMWLRTILGSTRGLGISCCVLIAGLAGIIASPYAAYREMFGWSGVAICMVGAYILCLHLWFRQQH